MVAAPEEPSNAKALPETGTAVANTPGKWLHRRNLGVQTLPENRNSRPSQEEEATTKKTTLSQNGTVQWKMMKKTRRHMERFTHEKHTRSYLSFMRRYEKVVTTTYHV